MQRAWHAGKAQMPLTYKATISLLFIEFIFSFLLGLPAGINFIHEQQKKIKFTHIY